MIILDTNVISELAKEPAQISPFVFNWFQRLDPALVFITTVALAELGNGIEMLPEGRRKRDLATTVEAAVQDIFEDRILLFDEAAARAFALVCFSKRRQGVVPKIMDMQMAAIALSRGMQVATRDFKDFAGCGVPLINPWEPAR